MGLSQDRAVQDVCRAVFPVVMLCQINKGLAYPVNGVIMGGLDWSFSTLFMWVANAVCVGIIYKMKPLTSLSPIWWGLSFFMAIQWISGALRFSLSEAGVWGLLNKKSDNNIKSQERPPSFS